MIQYSFLMLPYDVLINIIKNLDLRDLRNLMLTCKTLRDMIINENAIWKLLFKNKLIVTNTHDRNLQGLTKIISIENVMDDKVTNFYCKPNTEVVVLFDRRKSLHILNYFTTIGHIKPLSTYNQCRVSSNWCKGIYRNQIIIQHRANYMPWLRLHSECLLLSLQSNLKCYPLDRRGYPDCKHTLWTIEVPKVKRNDVRTNDISRFVVKDNIIVCGNRDGSATIYTYENNQKPCLFYHIQDCHKNGQFEVSAVELISSKSNPCLITASGYSSELSLWYWKWRENSYDSLPPLEHHTLDCDTNPLLPVEMGLRSLSVNQTQDKLAIGLNRNSKPILLDITICKLITNADDTRNARQVVRDIQWHDENTLVYVTHFGTLELIDIRTNSVVYETEDPFQSSLYCVRSDGDHAIIVGSAEYSRCVLFDSRTRNHVQVYFTQKTPSPIYSLDFDSTKLIAAADRSTAALNFNVSVATTKARDYSHTFQVIRNS